MLNVYEISVLCVLFDLCSTIDKVVIFRNLVHVLVLGIHIVFNSEEVDIVIS
jgi:hypothetical protein